MLLLPLLSGWGTSQKLIGHWGRLQIYLRQLGHTLVMPRMKKET